jgi:hypothetical protein
VTSRQTRRKLDELAPNSARYVNSITYLLRTGSGFLGARLNARKPGKRFLSHASKDLPRTTTARRLINCLLQIHPRSGTVEEAVLRCRACYQQRQSLHLDKARADSLAPDGRNARSACRGILKRAAKFEPAEVKLGPVGALRVTSCCLPC